MNFGEFLKAQREEKGISLEELAAAAGITAETLSAIERGEIKRPPPERLKGFAERLGIPLETLTDFFSEEAETPKEALSDDGASAIEAASKALMESAKRFEEIAQDLGGLLVATPGTIQEASEFKPTGKVWEVVVIQEGMSLNGRFYPRKTLEDSLKLWEGEDVCVYGNDPNRRRHVSHEIEMRFPQGTYANKVGNLTNLRGRVTEGRYEIVADFVCTKPDFRQELLETYEATGKMPFFSIHADGNLVDGICEGKRCRIVTSITATKELTIVSKPAAGGRAFRLVAGQQNQEEGKMLTKLRKFVSSRLPKTAAALVESQDDTWVVETAIEQLREADPHLAGRAATELENGAVDKAALLLECILDRGGDAKPEDQVAHQVPPQSGEGAKVTEDALDRAEKAEKRFALTECKLQLNEALASAELPEVAVAQVRARFQDRIFEAADLEQVIKDKKELLALNAGGKALMESDSTEAHVPRAQVLVESADTFQRRMDLMVGFNPKVALDNKKITEAEYNEYRACDEPGMNTPRQIYIDASGDYRLRHTGGKSLREAVNNTTFSLALGDSMNKKLAQDFETANAAQWEPFIEKVDNMNLKSQKRIILGGIGDLPTVAEGGNYVDLGHPVEYQQTYSLGKRGGLISITEEAVINDDLGFIQSIPRKLRSAAMENENKLAWSLLTGNGGGGGINTDLSYDGAAHYHANHFNTNTTALSHAALVTARMLQRNTRVVAWETALNDATDINSSDTSVVVDDATGIRAGMYVRIDAEWLYVSSVSSNTLTVTRGALGSTAASHTDNTAMYATSGVLNLDESGPGFGPTLYVVVPSELEGTLMEILTSEKVPGSANHNANFLKPQYERNQIVPVVVNASYLGGDTNNWYTAVPWQIAKGLEFGYFNGQRIPQLINETNEQVGQVFLADTMRWKVKHRFGGVALAHEGRTGHIVA